eukprot:10308591-Heterocapsa_arctica.AAC.1
MPVRRSIIKKPSAIATPSPTLPPCWGWSGIKKPVPLIAGIWGVRCLPGPAWENAPRGATWGT